ncbi:phage/plasmid primase, P4 family [Streptomyces mirabilis]|uniref:phage/plasmid primase, P4 family n=1 Tax=Streptomyces mirabilis TaxID=68239 RepID=UPI0033A87A8B
MPPQGDSSHPQNNKLTAKHLAHLKASAIDDDVIKERGYWSMSRGDMDAETKFRNLGIPKWFVSEPKQHHGLVIPMYGPRGDRVSVQYRPDDAPKDYRKEPGRDGQRKAVKYISPAGHSSRLDVHPRNTDKLLDPTIPLWITEGIKKGDALTSAGACAVSLTGVFNWRSGLATLGDWEDICLKGRTVVICFDADARTNANVLRAMIRLGRWLKSRSATPEFLIVPAQVGESTVKGVDDFFHAGGAMEMLTQARTRTEPTLPGSSSVYTDAYMADTVADEVFAGQFTWTPGMGWLRWSGQVWRRCDESAAVEAVRLYVIGRCEDALRRSRTDDGVAGEVAGWNSMLTATRLRAVTSLAKGSIQAEDDELDADPDLLNCANCVVDLRTGERRDHDPALMMTRVTGIDYDPDAVSADWDAVLTAMTDDTREWMQLRLGQAATGYRTPDDIVPVLQGTGSNGKSTLMESISIALGTYHAPVPDALLVGKAERDESMVLRGARFALIEETPEAAHLNTVMLKKITSAEMEGHHLYAAKTHWWTTHSLFVNTNYKPVVSESDDGTWRRLALVGFPFKFVDGTPNGPWERAGDPTLRGRIESGDPVILRAALRWIVDGAQAWYAADKVLPKMPESVQVDTGAWRKKTDLILAYWEDHLVITPGQYVLATDLFEDWKLWAQTRGYAVGTLRTFVNRFEQHSTTRNSGIEQRDRMRQSKELRLSRPENTLLPDVPGQFSAWIGVRFRTDRDADCERCSAPTTLAVAGGRALCDDCRSDPDGKG